MLQEKNKAIEIIKVLTGTVQSIQKETQNLPLRKHRKNVFVKTYNRRPQNKQKIKAATVNIVMNVLMAAFHVERIRQTPTPKYKKG